MGVQLYKDRDLAIRELYQNALDACRYRRARTEYLDRTGPGSFTYDGEISFVQAHDEDGREYVECSDNGIGMGEAELRGVFSKAGARFAEQPDFRIEQSAWDHLDPPVRLYPNSRFGIGVLSYFMLADEIRVTTCRMGLDGLPGPVLEVSICGPGHLFRIVKIAERGEQPGTGLRLYLKEEPEDARPWSCVDVLERVLAIAEFSTTARRADQEIRWEPGILKARQQPDGERFGYDAHGIQIAWTDAPPGTHVIWTERGGAILVDGLVIRPAPRTGALSTAASGLTGVVVNLSGLYAPARLSADRMEVLDKLSVTLRGLLEAAVDALAHDDRLPTFEWICRLAEDYIHLADIVVAAAMRQRKILKYEDLVVDVRRSGCLPADVELLLGDDFEKGRLRTLWMSVLGDAPLHVLLWRMLAHRCTTLLAELVKICPEIGGSHSVLPAMPSDQLLLANIDHIRPTDRHYWFWNDFETFWMEGVVRGADRLGTSLRGAAARSSVLGVNPLKPEMFPAARSLSKVELALVDSGIFYSMDEPADVSDLIYLAAKAAVDVGEVAEQCRRFGVTVPDRVIELALAAVDDDLLRRDPRRETRGRLEPDEVVTVGHIAQASLIFSATVPDVCDRLAEYGLACDAGGLPERPDRDTVTLLSADLDGGPPWLERDETVPPAHVLAAARVLRLKPGEVVDRLVGLGFDVATPSAPFPGTEDPDVFDGHVLEDSRLGFLRPPGPVRYSHLFEAARVAGCELERVIARLRAYGFDIPLESTPPYSEPDLVLFQDAIKQIWDGLATEDTVPFAHLVVAAHSFQSSPPALAASLASRGVGVSCLDYPDGLDGRTALRILRENDQTESYFRKGHNVPFQRLLELSLNLRVGMEQVAGWLREMGIEVPDLRETLLEALARVPRAAE